LPAPAPGATPARPRDRPAPDPRGSRRRPPRGRSDVVAPQRQRHAPRPAAAAHQLAALDRDRDPLALLHAVVAREQLRRAHDPEPAVIEVAHRGLVSYLLDYHSRSRGEEVAGARPLLALLQRAVVAPADDRLERLTHGPH